MQEDLDRVIKADQCAQYVDVIGIAANDANHLIAHLGATFECIREAGLKFITIHMPVRTSRILLVRFLSNQSANIFFGSFTLFSHYAH